jgi:glucarate dehydratase
MKIVKAEIIPLLIPIEASQLWGLGNTSYYSRMIVRLYTDDGLAGLGEIRGEAERKTAFEVMSQQILGESPWNLHKIREKIARAQFVKILGLNVNRVFSAIECACLDIQGKASGRPVYDLLGGKVRDKIPFAAYLFYTRKSEDGTGRDLLEPEQMAEYCQELSERFGFTSFKLKGGVLEPDREVDTLAAIRKRFPKAGLRIDPNAKWGIGASLRVARRLEDLEIEYLEDPTHGMDGMAAVNHKIPWMPLATNMCVRAFEDIPYAAAKRAVDVILADPDEYGGLRAIVELDRICEVFNFDINLHSPQEFGVSMASYLHLAAALPRMGRCYALDSHYHRLLDDVLEGGMLKYTDGYMEVPNGPGLGITLDEEKVQQYHRLYLEKGGFSPFFSRPNSN